VESGEGRGGGRERRGAGGEVIQTRGLLLHTKKEGVMEVEEVQTSTAGFQTKKNSLPLFLSSLTTLEIKIPTKPQQKVRDAVHPTHLQQLLARCYSSAALVPSFKVPAVDIDLN